MKKILLSLALIATIQLSANDNPKQEMSSQKFYSHLDLTKLTKCPEYTNINNYRMMNESERLVRVRNDLEKSASTATVEVENFKEGSVVVIDGCVGVNNAVELKIDNTFYWVK